MNEVAEGPVAGTPAVVPAAAALDAATATGTTGQRLKAARERRGLSSQKAADKMHLDLWVIEALESDQFDKIGPSVYAKGHLKRYAGILGLPAAEIMAAYGAPPAEVAPQRGAMRLRTQEPVGIELPWGTIATAALAAVVISGVVWLRPGVRAARRHRRRLRHRPGRVSPGRVRPSLVPPTPTRPVDDGRRRNAGRRSDDSGYRCPRRHGSAGGRGAGCAHGACRGPRYGRRRWHAARYRGGPSPRGGQGAAAAEFFG